MLFFNPNDDLRFYNYGVPLEPVSRLSEGTLAQIRARVRSAQAAVALRVHRRGRAGVGRSICGRGPGRRRTQPAVGLYTGELLSAAEIPGLAIRRLTPESARADLAAFISVQAQSFGEDDRVEPTDAQVDDLRRRSGRGTRYFLGLLDDTPVATAAHTAPLDGFTELVGIATLAAYRRRGIAGALVAAMTQAAFWAGVRVAFLSRRG